MSWRTTSGSTGLWAPRYEALMTLSSPMPASASTIQKIVQSKRTTSLRSNATAVSCALGCERAAGGRRGGAREQSLHFHVPARRGESPSAAAGGVVGRMHYQPGILRRRISVTQAHLD